MAIERGKLSNYFFQDPTKMSHRALGRIAKVLENSPPFKAAMSIKPLRSAFLGKLVDKSKEKFHKLVKDFG